MLLLPPGVASRRAGRRIRAGLLRSGMLRAVVALPPGSAPPHSVALHLWVLRASAGGGTDAGAGVLLVDAAEIQPEPSGGTQRAGRAAIDWSLLHRRVVSAIQVIQVGDEVGNRSAHHAVVPVIDLLDEEVDLTPARHVPKRAASANLGLRRSWNRFGTLLHELRDLTATLSALELSGDEPAGQGTVTVGDLLRAGALTMRAGQQPADGAVRTGDAPDDAVPLLTITDVLAGGRPSGWLPASEASAGETAGTLTVTVPEEVVVVGAYRAFGAWVDTDAPRCWARSCPPSGWTPRCSTPGSWPVACEPRPTRGRPEPTPRPPPASTSAGCRCCGFPLRSSAVTARPSGGSPPSNGRCGRRGRSAGSWSTG